MKLRIGPLGFFSLLIAIGVNAGLLAIVASEMATNDLAAADKAEWSPDLPASIGKVASRRPIESYREILVRPVFFKSREPFVAPPPPPPVLMPTAPPPEIVDPGLVLGGVMIKNNAKKAYMLSRAGADGTWTAEGDEFMGWKVRSISGSGARLEQQGRSIDLQLYPWD